MKKLTISVLTVAVVFVLSFVSLLYINFYQADQANKDKTLTGYVFGARSSIEADENTGTPLEGATVTLYGKNRTYEDDTNELGEYSISLRENEQCVYKVIVTHPEYNAERKYFKAEAALKGASWLNDYTFNFNLDKITTASKYRGTKYWGGYGNGLRVAADSVSYFRNQINPGAFGSGHFPVFDDISVPSHANIKLTIKQSFESVFVDPLEPEKDSSYQVKILINAIPGSWDRDLSMLGVGPLAEQEFTIDLSKSMFGETFEFDIDLSGMSPKNRYYTYVNGFMVYMQDLMPADKYQPVWIDFINNPGVNYSEWDDYTEIAEPALRTCITDVAGKYYYFAIPYVLGGSGLINPRTADPDGRPVDCSRLVQAAYKWAAIPVEPRTAKGQQKFMKEIGLDELKPGDVLFHKAMSSNTTGHVGIFMGKGGDRYNFIHAANPRADIKSESVSRNTFIRKWTTYLRYPKFD